LGRRSAWVKEKNMANAKATINLDMDITAIVKAAGKTWNENTAPYTFWLAGTTLTVADCDQNALDAAIAARNIADDKAARDMADLRSKRNGLLAATDWWGVSDRTMSSEETKYRKDLRDLPANTSDASDPTWPTKP